MPLESLLPFAEEASILNTRSDYDGDSFAPRLRGTERLRRRAWFWQARYAPYLFVLPFLILFSEFMLYPLAWSVSLSLQKNAGPVVSRFAGLANYRFLITDRMFWFACMNTM